MPKTGKKELIVEGIAVRGEVEIQLEATLYSRIQEIPTHLVATEEEGKHQGDTGDPMEQMEEHHRDKDSQVGAKEDQTNILTAKWH